MADVVLTWLGHGSFRLDSPGGKRIYVDPWLDSPTYPEGEREPERIDILAITHGHGDHVGSAIELGKRYSPSVVAIFELAEWLESEGVPNGSANGMNKGGTIDVDGIKFTMTNAVHSGGFTDSPAGIVYLGDPAGYVVQLENGLKVYFSGDTAVFGDMQLIARLYAPDVAVLPIGGRLTMDPREAALALELLGVKRCVPGHYGTFPPLTGTPDELRKLASGVEVIALEPGEAITL